MVIGLETHVELQTKTKIFCGCEAKFGAAPNSCVCPVCMGLPGALPVFNEKVLRYAVKAGLALGCQINERSRFDRKNYFYPDLPKAYQISQFYEPLCEKGALIIQTSAGEKRIGITRVHIEEDAGKLLHDEKSGTLIDMNRCGVPLIEIVSEPDIRSAEEAVAYLRKLRAVISYTGVSDCRMNEGSLRCDVNLSVHRAGEPFGTRTEMKNLNSFQSVERAITAEYQRQCEALHRSETIVQETRRFDQKTGKTSTMRRKENSDDYRYFPDPDLPPVYVPVAMREEIRRSMPVMPDERKRQYTAEYGLSPYAAEQMVSERVRADEFERAMGQSREPKLAMQLSSLMMGEAFASLPEGKASPIPAQDLAALARLLCEGRINSTTGKRILSVMMERRVEPVAYAEENGLFAIRDQETLEMIARETVEENQAMAQSYREGKTKVLMALMGRCMGKAKGQADASLLEEALLKALQE